MSVLDDVNVYAPPADPARTPRAVYVHVPFCLHRCGYCDFTLVADRDDLVPAYLDALENELTHFGQHYTVDTIYIGGGTPTHLTVEQLQRLFNLIHRHFDLAEDAEYSIEANPDGLDDDRLNILQANGVNRLSLGVQSFDADVLKTLERKHSLDEAVDVIQQASKLFPNISADLIFGVPGQSLELWERSLDIVANLPLSHVSTYGLTFEKGTSFFQRLGRGELSRVPDQAEHDMYAVAIEMLSETGLTQYEISNFARPQQRCRHNLTYWNAEEYFAFGPGAARYVNEVRSTNARHVTRWINSWLADSAALQESERLSPSERIREAVFLGLRMIDGIPVQDFTRRFGISPVDADAAAAAKHIGDGLLEIVDGRLRLTRRGRFVADSVVTDFL